MLLLIIWSLTKSIFNPHISCIGIRFSSFTINKSRLVYITLKPVLIGFYSTILFVGKGISVSDYLYHHHTDLPHATSTLDDKGSSNMFSIIIKVNKRRGEGEHMFPLLRNIEPINFENIWFNKSKTKPSNPWSWRFEHISKQFGNPNRVVLFILK